MTLFEIIARAAKDICKTGPFTAEGVTDIYGLTFSSLSNVNDLKGANNNLSVTSTTGQIISSIASLTPFGAVATSPAAGALTLIKISVDAQSTGQIGVGDILNVAGNGIALTGGVIALGTSAFTAGLIIAGLGASVGLAGLIAGLLDWKINISADQDPCGCNEKINNKINDNFRDAVTFAPRDPLALDLDNDGIETVAINPTAPILFDHNGDGAASATGWLKGDDGWLVNDLDQDGKITSGKELLGVDTDITVGGVTRKATTGFEALRALDTHQIGDGKNLFDSRDAAFSQLRIWQDKNQNGETDVGELSTLSALGIVSIQLQETTTNVNLGGGNSVTGKALVTRRVGTNTSTSEVDSVLVTNDSAANLNLADTDLPDVAVTDTARALHYMQSANIPYWATAANTFASGRNRRCA